MSFIVLSRNSSGACSKHRIPEGYRKEFRKRYRKVSDCVKMHASRKGTVRYRKVFRKVFPEAFYAIVVFPSKG